jgi:hypothetical protein
MDLYSKYLALNGSIVLLIGLLCGYPFGVAILKKDEELIRAWKLAHGSLTLGGALSLAIAACLSFLKLDIDYQAIVSISYIVSGYSFSGALLLEPVWRVRGLKWSKKSESRNKNNFVFVCNSLGAVSSLTGTIALIIGIWCTL